MSLRAQYAAVWEIKKSFKRCHSQPPPLHTPSTDCIGGGGLPSHSLRFALPSCLDGWLSEWTTSEQQTSGERRSPLPSSSSTGSRGPPLDPQLWALQWRDSEASLPPGIESFIETMRDHRSNPFGSLSPHPASVAATSAAGVSRHSHPQHHQRGPSPRVHSSLTPIITTGRSRRGEHAWRDVDSRPTTNTTHGTGGSALTTSSSSSSPADFRTTAVVSRSSSTGGRGEGGGSSSGRGGGGDALAAIQRWGETHAAAAIPASVLVRDRGVFGDVTKKELHQMVVSILNKVTTDAEKYVEVKNALLRLPIPEASPEALEKVLSVFFRKATSESKFCSLYAKLLKNLCCGGAAHGSLEGSQASSDSLEVRVGQGMVTLCLSAFQSLAQQASELEASGDEGKDDQMKVIRDQLCGTVRFSLELHSSGFIDNDSLSQFIRTCCTGRRDGVLTPQPSYVPNEAQMSAMITLLSTDSAFLEQKEWLNGSDHLGPALMEWASYWKQHYPLSRIRFLLISVTERLAGILRHTPKPEVQLEYDRLMGLLPQAEAIAGLTLMCERGFLSLSALVSDLCSKNYSLHHVTAFLVGWVRRSIVVVKEQWARKHTGELLALMSSEAPHEMLRDAVRSEVESQFQDGTYEYVNSFFSYFAELVLCKVGFVGPSMLNDGIHWLSSLEEWCVPYLQQVCPLHLQYVSSSNPYLGDELRKPPLTTLMASPCPTAHIDLTQFFSSPSTRYRPLHSILVRGGGAKTLMSAWRAASPQARAAIKASSLEMCMFDLLLDAAQDQYVASAAMEKIFECVRESPQLAVDPHLAAEVLSAILITEYCLPEAFFFELSFSVLQLAVDQEDRMLSELLLLKEWMVLSRDFASPKISSPPRVHALVSEMIISQDVFAMWRTYMESTQAPTPSSTPLQQRPQISFQTSQPGGLRSPFGTPDPSLGPPPPPRALMHPITSGPPAIPPLGTSPHMQPPLHHHHLQQQQHPLHSNNNSPYPYPGPIYPPPSHPQQQHHSHHHAVPLQHMNPQPLDGMGYSGGASRPPPQHRGGYR